MRWMRWAVRLLVVAVVTTLEVHDVVASQYVLCTVTTADLEATARADLSSVCSTKDMESLMLQFEKQVTKKLEGIEATITGLASKLAERGKQSDRFYKPRMLQDTYHGNVKTSDISAERQLKYTEEMAHYNPISSTQKKRVFEYRWNVTGFKRDTLRSPSFYVFPRGYRMYLRLRPHSTGHNMFVYAGLTHGDFDHALNWPFALRHKVQVVSGREAMESRLWDPAGLCGGQPWQRPHLEDNPECVGFAFPRYALLRGSTVIKLIVLLE